MKTERSTHIANGILISLFMLVLILPLVGTPAGWDFYQAEGENRRLADRPDFKTEPWASLPEKFEAYYNDHFGFRNTFIRRYNRLARDLFEIQPSQVIFGQDQWLFINDDKVMKDFLGYRQFTDKELENWCDKLTERRRRLAEHGIAYLYVIPPNKCAVYPEKLLPETQAAEAPYKQVDQLLDHLKKTEAPQPLHLKQVLLEAKKHQQVYFPADTHWNDEGSYIGYVSIINALKPSFPDLSPRPLEEFPREELGHIGDLGRLLGLSEKYTRPRNRILPLNERIAIKPLDLGDTSKWPHFLNSGDPTSIAINPDGRYSAVIFHDSFADFGLMELLRADFRQTVFISARPNVYAIEYVIKHIRPDIVIEERLQRSLHSD